MTDEELLALNDAFHAACGTNLPHCALEHGYFRIPDDILRRYAQASIERGKPVDWREILGPTIREHYGVDENGMPRAIS